MLRGREKQWTRKAENVQGKGAQTVRRKTEVKAEENVEEQEKKEGLLTDR